MNTLLQMVQWPRKTVATIVGIVILNAEGVISIPPNDFGRPVAQWKDKRC